MKLAEPKCPICEDPAVGTMDLIPGVALFDDDPTDESAVIEYMGETEVDWDGQQRITNDAGESKVTCGRHYWFTKITG